MMLRDVSGFPRFAQQLSESVADLSLALAGENEDHVQAVLDQTRGNLTNKLSGVVGAKTAAGIADAFVDAVVCRRREIRRAVAGIKLKIAGRGCPFPSGNVLAARRMYPRGELLGDADIFKRGRVG